MLPASPELLALLNTWRSDTTATPYVAELYTWTLSGGAVIRWTSADTDIVWNGDTFLRGPGITRSQISRQVGTTVSSLDVTLQFDGSVLQNGIPLSRFIASGGFSFATFRFERAYAAAPNTPIVGTLPKFSGRMTQLKDTGETAATLTISSWMSLLNVQVPVNVWQPPCLHTLFDDGCQLQRETFAQEGIVLDGSGDKLTLSTNLQQGAGYFDLGKIVFTSGFNVDQTRTVKQHYADGRLDLVRALPEVITPGDHFTAYPGCDLTSITCRDKFDNLKHRKGYDYVPTNETAAP